MVTREKAANQRKPMSPVLLLPVSRPPKSLCAKGPPLEMIVPDKAADAVGLSADGESECRPLSIPSIVGAARDF